MRSTSHLFGLIPELRHPRNSGAKVDLGGRLGRFRLDLVCQLVAFFFRRDVVEVLAGRSWKEENREDNERQVFKAFTSSTPTFIYHERFKIAKKLTTRL